MKANASHKETWTAMMGTTVRSIPAIRNWAVPLKISAVESVETERVTTQRAVTLAHKIVEPVLRAVGMEPALQTKPARRAHKTVDPVLRAVETGPVPRKKAAPPALAIAVPVPPQTDVPPRVKPDAGGANARPASAKQTPSAAKLTGMIFAWNGVRTVGLIAKLPPAEMEPARWTRTAIHARKIAEHAQSHAEMASASSVKPVKTAKRTAALVSSPVAMEFVTTAKTASVVLRTAENVLPAVETNFAALEKPVKTANKIVANVRKPAETAFAPPWSSAKIVRQIAGNVP